MKKAITWILALLLVVLAAGCANASGSRGTVPEELAEYLTQNGLIGT